MFGRDADGHKTLTGIRLCYTWLRYVPLQRVSQGPNKPSERLQLALTVFKIRKRPRYYTPSTSLSSHSCTWVFRLPTSYGRAVASHTAHRTEDFHPVYHNIALVSSVLNLIPIQDIHQYLSAKWTIHNLSSRAGAGDLRVHAGNVGAARSNATAKTPVHNVSVTRHGVFSGCTEISASLSFRGQDQDRNLDQ